jgi:hypothetical protein
MKSFQVSDCAKNHIEYHLFPLESIGTLHNLILDDSKRLQAAIGLLLALALHLQAQTSQLNSFHTPPPDPVGF